MRGFLRRLKAAAVNALVWGGAWFAIGVAVHAATSLLSRGLLSIEALLVTGLFVGAIGTFVGGLFSAIVGVAYRRRQVEDLNAAGFTMLGIAAAMLAYPFVAAFMSGGRILPSSTLEWLAFASGAGVSGLIGAFTAFATIRVAQSGGDAERIGATHHHDWRRLDAS